MNAIEFEMQMVAMMAPRAKPTEEDFIVLSSSSFVGICDFGMYVFSTVKSFTNLLEFVL